jgi:HEPN domain-containing protein
MTDHMWRVVVAREIDAAANDALRAEGVTHISGHSAAGLESNSLILRAEDEERARAAIERALGEDVPIRESKLMPVFVHALVEPAARAAFEEAAGEDARIGGVIEDETTGSLEVYFELDGGSVDRAFNEARGLYVRVVEAAGLEVPDGLEYRMSGFEVLLSQATRDRQLLDRARELFEQHEHELAVIVAQTACEVLVADAIRNFLQPHASDALQGWLIKRIRSFTFMDDPTKDLWERITRSRVQGQDFWDDYLDHVRRRNWIAHQGILISEGEAEASLDAATALFDYVERMIGNIPTPPA